MDRVNWTRANLEMWPAIVLSRPSWVKPVVSLVDIPGGRVIVKDVARVIWILRPLARWLLDREVEVLEGCRNVAGIPRVLGRVDRLAYAFSVVPGQPIDRESFQRSPRHMAAQLKRIVGSLHGRGVYHLDLRQRKNVLVDAEGRLGVVDFGASVRLHPWLDRMLGGVLQFIDCQAPLKFLALYAPESLTRREARHFLRGQRLRKLWVFSPHRRRAATWRAKRRLREYERTRVTSGRDGAA